MKFKVWLEEKKYFIGNCVDGLDDDSFCNTVAYDATQLAQLVENGKEISFNDFLINCEVDPQFISQISKAPANYEFYVNASIYWIYDNDKDIHYFYA